MINLMKTYISSGAVMPAEIQRVAWRMVAKKGNGFTREEEALRLKLVGLKDAPKDLRAIYSELPEMDLKVAYLCRDDITDEELTRQVLNEKRAGVLKELMKHPVLAPKVKAIVESKFLAKPTKAVAPMMLESDNEDVLLKAASVFNVGFARASSEVQSSIIKAVTRLLRKNPDKGNELIAGLDNEIFLFNIPGVAELSPESKVKIIEAGFNPSIRATYNYYAHSQRSQAVINLSLQAEELVLDALERLVANPELERARALYGAQSSGLYTNETLTERIVLILIENGRSKWEDSEVGRKVSARIHAHNSDDPAVLAQIATAALNDNNPRPLEGLLLNPSTPENVMLEILSSRLSYSINSNVLESVAVMRDEIEVITAALLGGRHGQTIFDELGLSVYPDPEEGAKSLIRKALEGTSHGFPAILSSDKLTLEQKLDNVPMDRLGGGYYGGAPKELMEEIMKRQAAALGDDEESWALIAALLANYSGTAGDLIRTCEAFK